MVKIIFVVGLFKENPQLKYLKLCSSRYRSKSIKKEGQEFGDNFKI